MDTTQTAADDADAKKKAAFSRGLMELSGLYRCRYCFGGSFGFGVAGFVAVPVGGFGTAGFAAPAPGAAGAGTPDWTL
jgi:hypothetical protein